MEDTSWKRAKQIFHEALEKSGPERKAHVAAACGDQSELLAQVEALLAAHDEAGSFLAEPTAAQTGEAPHVSALATELAPAERPGAMIGPYKLLQVIGEGAFGVVYMAEQERPLRRRVALKIIKLGMDTVQVIARFEAERQALALMEHPNIAKVFDAGATETGRPYFVMELVKGVSLTEFCDANRLSTHERLDLFTRICSAVQHAHQKGIIHRDIKPSNVMVTLHDGKPVPKVIDFGIAKATHQRLTEKTLFTRYGQFIGTPAYMSPEQAEMSGLDVDTRTDIYALGVLLYELLTGTTPFDARALREAGYGEIRRIIREEEPPRPSTRLSTMGGTLTAVAERRHTDARGLARLVRGDLDWIVMKALDKDRVRRYDSASGFAEDIARHLGGEPVLARPPSAAYKLRKFVRKHRGSVAAVAAIVVTVLFLGSMAFWQGLRAQRQAMRVRAISLLATAQETEDPLLKALLTFELANVPELPGRLNVAREAANFPLPTAVLRGHGGYITSAAFSPDGSRLATGARDATARVWPLDGAGGPVVLGGHRVGVWAVEFSPDGRFVVTASEDGAARVWRADGTGEPVILEGHEGRLWDAAFSPDGTRVVTASADRTARVWRADGTGEPVILRGHEKALRTAVFDADGSRVLTTSYDGTARLWRADGTGEVVVLRGHDGWVWRAAFSPDGERVVTASRDGTARVWRADGTGESVIFKHDDALWDAAFSPDGARVVTASGDWTARVWHADGSGDPVILRGHEDTVWRAAFSPDGERVVTASEDGTARLWQEGREPVVLGRHEGRVYEAAFSPDGSRIVTASADGTARLWRADDTGEALVLRGHPNDVLMSLFSPDGSLLLTAGEDVRVWRADGRGAPVVLGERAEWQVASFSPDGTRVVTTTKQGKVRVWRADGSGDPVVLDEEGASRAAFDPDGDRVVTANRDGVARVWRADGTAPPVEFRGHEAMLFGSAFSPDGNRVATSSADGTIRVWQADGTGDPVVLRSQVPGPLFSSGFSPDGSQVLGTAGDFSCGYLWPADGSGEPVVLRRPDGNVHVDEFSPDGRRVVAGSWDGTVVVWALDRPDEPIVMRGHVEEVWVTAFSPDGDRVVSASGDGTARVWQADGTGEPLILRHGDWVTHIAFSPDGTRAVTSSWDETARVWRIAWPGLLEYLRGRVTTCLTPEQRARYLGESEAEARAAFATCEGGYGREPEL